MRFSIIVCTFNRSRALARLLDSLKIAIAYAGVPGELIIVDNNSNDNTHRVIAEFECDIPVVYLFEPTPGKSKALNTAVLKTRGDLLIFTDDDVTVDEGWISAYLQAADGGQFEWFGGTIYPRWPAAIPSWYVNSDNKQAFSGYLVHYEASIHARAYHEDDPLPWGASMAMRRSSLRNVGEFRQDIGVFPKRRGAGEDVDMIRRLCAAGARGYYVRDAVCYHHLAGERLRYLAFMKYGFSRGIDHYRVEQTRPRGSMRRAGLHCVKSVHQLLRGRGDNVRINLICAGNELGRLYGEWLVARQSKMQNPG